MRVFGSILAAAALCVAPAIAQVTTSTTGTSMTATVSTPPITSTHVHTGVATHETTRSTTAVGGTATRTTTHTITNPAHTKVITHTKVKSKSKPRKKVHHKHVVIEEHHEIKTSTH
ncbi:MAG: hypothetical protein ABIP63_03870 [Thermoanaerobaculia bacterium]